MPVVSKGVAGVSPLRDVERCTVMYRMFRGNQCPLRIRIGIRIAAVGLWAMSGVSMAFGQATTGPTSPRVGGLPVGIVKEAFANPDPVTRQKVFLLIAQRIARSPDARARFLAVDPNDAATRFARLRYSVEMLTAARDQTDDEALRDKLAQVIAAIGVLNGSTP